MNVRKFVKLPTVHCKVEEKMNVKSNWASCAEDWEQCLDFSIGLEKFCTSRDSFQSLKKEKASRLFASIWTSLKGHKSLFFKILSLETKIFLRMTVT